MEPLTLLLVLLFVSVAWLLSNITLTWGKTKDMFWIDVNVLSMGITISMNWQAIKLLFLSVFLLCILLWEYYRGRLVSTLIGLGTVAILWGGGEALFNRYHSRLVNKVGDINGKRDNSVSL